MQLQQDADPALRFAAMRYLNKQNIAPSIENYEILYRGNLPEGKRSVPQAELLEQLYQKFNCARPDGLPWAQPVGQRCDRTQTQWRGVCALCGQHRLQRFTGVSGQAAGTPFGTDESQGKVRCPGVQSHRLPESEEWT